MAPVKDFFVKVKDFFGKSNYLDVLIIKIRTWQDVCLEIQARIKNRKKHQARTRRECLSLKARDREFQSSLALLWLGPNTTAPTNILICNVSVSYLLLMQKDDLAWNKSGQSWKILEVLISSQVNCQKNNENLKCTCSLIGQKGHMKLRRAGNENFCVYFRYLGANCSFIRILKETSKQEGNLVQKARYQRYWRGWDFYNWFTKYEYKH